LSRKSCRRADYPAAAAENAHSSPERAGSSTLVPVVAVLALPSMTGTLLAFAFPDWRSTPVARVTLPDSGEFPEELEELVFRSYRREFHEEGRPRRDPHSRPMANALRLYAVTPEIAFWAIPLCRIVVQPNGRLSGRLKEFVILATSIENQCAYCVANNEIMAKAYGVTEDEIEAIQRWESSDLLTDDEKLAIEWAVLVTRNQARSATETYDRLARAFSESEIVELTWLIGVFNMLNRLHEALHIDIDAPHDGIVHHDYTRGAIADDVVESLLRSATGDRDSR
jgi:uncharacterized peroxidase-related enzyme